MYVFFFLQTLLSSSAVYCMSVISSILLFMISVFLLFTVSIMFFFLSCLNIVFKIKLTFFFYLYIFHLFLFRGTLSYKLTKNRKLLPCFFALVCSWYFRMIKSNIFPDLFCAGVISAVRFRFQSYLFMCVCFCCCWCHREYDRSERKHSSPT